MLEIDWIIFNAIYFSGNKAKRDCSSDRGFCRNLIFYRDESPEGGVEHEVSVYFLWTYGQLMDVFFECRSN